MLASEIKEITIEAERVYAEKTWMYLKEELFTRIREVAEKREHIIKIYEDAYFGQKNWKPWLNSDSCRSKIQTELEAMGYLVDFEEDVDGECIKIGW